MISQMNLYKRVINSINSLEEAYSEKLNYLESRYKDTDYIELFNNEINDVDSLLNYYSNIKTHIERLSFERFLSSIINNEVEEDELLKELKNLELLRSTGLTTYTPLQEEYSKKILNKYIKKIKNNKDNTTSNENIYIDTTNSLNNLYEYKMYFTPMGLIKDIDDIDSFYNFIKELDLSDDDRKLLLIEVLKSNMAFHNKELKSRDIDKEQVNKLTKRRYLLDKDNISNIKEININDLLSPKETNTTNFFDPTIEDRVDKANESLKDNKDPYDLFTNYYRILLDNREDEDNNDLDIVEKATNYLNENKHLIENLNPYEKEDLNNTIKVYYENEDLREEVYKTTENKEELLTYEISKIFDSVDKEDPDYIIILARNLKKVIEYIESNKIKVR